MIFIPSLTLYYLSKDGEEGSIERPDVLKPVITNAEMKKGKS